jgi:NAD(P)-dependent dehydrogenase (short-subunit alcohol dehydrogenase family)
VKETRPVCLITGAGGRLGAALCKAFSPQFSVIAVYKTRLPPSELSLSKPDDRAVGAVLPVEADLTRRDDIERIIAAAHEWKGQIDAVVNCAADVKFHGRLLNLIEADEQGLSQLNVNCFAPMRLVSAIHQAFWKDSPPSSLEMNRSVVNVSSVSGLYAHKPAGQGFYSASKAALNMLTLCLALELAPYGVRANAICPSRIGTQEYLIRVCEAIFRLVTESANATVVTDI